MGCSTDLTAEARSKVNQECLSVRQVLGGRTYVVWSRYVWCKFCVAMLIDALKLRR
jgi:hypothetical protein